MENRPITVSRRLLAAMLGVLLVGCSTMEVTSDYDPEVSFANLKSYDWLPRPPKPTGDPRIDGNTLLENRIRAAVDSGLAARGFIKSSADPDFLVGFHVSLDKQRSVQVLNNYYGYGPGWGYRYRTGAAETYVYEYEEGTLILDIVEPEGRQLIWRGAARDEVHFKSTPEKDEAQLNEAVQKILARFPPE